MALVKLISINVNYKGLNFSMTKGDSKVIEESLMDDNLRAMVRLGRIEKIPVDRLPPAEVLSSVKEAVMPAESTVIKIADVIPSLDDKDVGRYLDQNTAVVTKALKKDKLNPADLKLLKAAEFKKGKRMTILKCIDFLLRRKYGSQD